MSALVHLAVDSERVADNVALALRHVGEFVYEFFSRLNELLVLEGELKARPGRIGRDVDGHVRGNVLLGIGDLFPHFGLRTAATVAGRRSRSASHSIPTS